MRILPLLFAASALLAARPAAAQLPTVAPGSAALAPGRVALGTDTFAMVLESGGVEREVARMTLRTEALRGLVRRIEVVRGADGSLVATDTFALRGADLSPVSQRSGDGDAAQALDFGAGRVRGHRRRAGADSAVDFALRGPAFYGNSMDLVLAALPLAEGYAALLPLADAEGPDTAEVEVEGRESVAAADGARCDAWRVRVVTGGGDGWYWIGAGDRRLVKFRTDAETPVTVLRLHGCAGRR